MSDNPLVNTICAVGGGLWLLGLCMGAKTPAEFADKVGDGAQWVSDNTAVIYMGGIDGTKAQRCDRVFDHLMKEKRENIDMGVWLRQCADNGGPRSV